MLKASRLWPAQLRGGRLGVGLRNEAGGQSLTESNCSAHDGIGLLLIEFIGPLRDATAAQADCATEFRTAAEKIDGLLFGHEHV
ncbi:hypothetical protein [Aeromicrobium stalagmiti]|uniref:hypothetical protein n=1 Tax=Aeromicrobium stalagmiti TaxID=2738988 RepID=UPI00156956F5|nr:hypothetical protein [Aeromicrobium stalagmiti]NRQ51780.1 hypothetical protein [Aeromicrobium stalagmiti]